MHELTAACLQVGYRRGESRDERIARVLTELRGAPAADLVVIPELWDVGYFAFDEYETAARVLDNALAPVATIVKELDRVVVAGSVLERDGDRLYNTCAVLNRDGSLLGTYRKKHLFAYGSREAELLSPGTENGVIETPLGTLGVSTCFDLRFPEQFAEMRRAGADLFVIPAAWPAPRAEHWDILVRARAIETQTPLIACNGTGDCEGVELAGQSAVVDARGNVLVRAEQEERWLVAMIDMDDTERWREEFPLHSVTQAAIG